MSIAPSYLHSLPCSFDSFTTSLCSLSSFSFPLSSSPFLSPSPLFLPSLFSVCSLCFPSSNKVKKEVKERLLRVRGQPALDKVSDVNVLCSVLKDFLSSLREPILTFRLHKTFLDALGWCQLHLPSLCLPEIHVVVISGLSLFPLPSLPPLPPAQLPSDAGSDEDTLAGLLEAIAELPPCNKDTLAFIILHLQK